METTVVKSALPLFLNGNSDKAILIVHGFRGYSGEFYQLAHMLNKKGYNVSLPRLPGHGTNKKNFIKTGWIDWISHIENTYYDLKSKYESVEIIGLSMGGVITLILASRLNPERIILLAPAMAVNDKLFKFTPLLKYFIKDVPAEWIHAPNDCDNSNDIEILGREYWSYNSPKQSSELYKLIRIAKKGLNKVTCPTLLMLSKGDETVPIEKAANILKSGLINCKLDEVTLEKSGHVLVTGVEKELVHKTIFDWLEK